MGRRQAMLAGLAGAAGWTVGALGRALPGLAGLGLVSYGAWLAWQPAGFVMAGVLILADQVADRLSSGRGKT